MFTGYSDQTVDFFWQIRFNNSRDWFQPQKQTFQSVIMQPTKELANELYDWFQQEYPQRNLNVHISRIYRDARRLFGRGPLNDHLWFSFQTATERRELAPCFWFELGCDGYGYGMGCWSAAAVAVNYRKCVDLDPDGFDALVQRFDAQSRFQLTGESYARSKGHTDERIGAWYNKKNISLSCHRSYDETAYSHELVDTLKDGYRFLMPYFELLDRAYRMVE